MAEIIAKGENVDWVSEELTCQSCGTVHRITPQDITELSVFLYPREAYYNCPGCETVNSYTDLPPHVLNLVKKNIEGKQEKERRENLGLHGQLWEDYPVPVLLALICLGVIIKKIIFA